MSDTLATMKLRITIVIDPHRARQWHRELKTELEARGHLVALQLRPGALRMPATIGMIQSFERLLQRHRQQTPGTAWNLRGLPIPANDGAEGQDLVIDLTGQELKPTGRTLRPVYGESLIEEAAIATFLSGRSPMAGVWDSEAPGFPLTTRVAVEDRLHLSRALDNLGARVLSMLLSAVDAVSKGERSHGTQAVTLSGAHAWRAANAYNGLVMKAQQVLNRVLRTGPHWFVGWRAAGADRMMETLRLAGSGWQKLPDDGQRFYADPFLVVREGRTWLFLEEFPYATEKGILSVVELGPKGPIGRPRPILETGSHLSYPFIFEHNGEMLMMPENSGANRLDLYRAVEFPYVWERHSTLLDGIDLHDATLLNRDGRFYLFAARGKGAASSWDNLHIWSAPTLEGNWTAHRRNPVVVDARSARPAGAFFERNGELWRPAQDCADGYGAGLALCRVTRLDEQAFTQEVVTTIRPGPGWPGIGLHSLNWAGGIEVIDGCVNRRR